MTLYEELKARGLVAQITDEEIKPDAEKKEEAAEVSEEKADNE